MPIRSVNEFISAVGGEGVGPSGQATPPTPDYENRVEWGPPTSLAGQDAMSRIGIPFGAPSDSKVAAMEKTSAAFHGATHSSLTSQRQELVKEAVLGAIAGGVARRGLQALSRFGSRYAPKLTQRLSQIARPGGRLQRAAALGSKEILPAGSRASAMASFAPGFAGDVAMEGYGVSRALQHKPGLFQPSK